MRAGLVLAASVVAVWLFLREVPVPVKRPEAGAASSAADALPPEAAGAARLFLDDDSGLIDAFRFTRPIRDPQSLKDIRASWEGAGLRGRDAVTKQLALVTEPQLRVKLLISLGRLNLYDGMAQEAEGPLDEAHALVMKHPELAEWRVMVVQLQALAGLRRAETENCVQRHGHGSCILPIAQVAQHGMSAGSRRAVEKFLEVERLRPGDMGTRWLLNIAAMTLGEQQKLPASLRIPDATFKSAKDIGKFEDVAADAGVNKLNTAGASVMDDFDGDGWLDLIVGTGCEYQAPVYYRNRGDGRFEKVPDTGLEDQIAAFHFSHVDYDNDGKLDLFISRGAWKGAPMRRSMMRNLGGGKFEDVTAKTRIIAPVDSQVAVWADYDNDGWADLFIGGETVRCRLYHNKRDGTFEELALPAGLANRKVFCKGAAWGDIDGDRYPDLFVQNLEGISTLYINRKDGTFRDSSAQFGVTGPHHGFSCWTWDYDNDGDCDIYATSYDRNLTEAAKSVVGQPHKLHTGRLWRNDGNKLLTDVTVEMGLDHAIIPMGSSILDADGDGRLDMYFGTGAPSYSYLLPNRLFVQDGKRFVDVSYSSGTAHLQKGHQVACGDYDRDGDVDIFIQMGGVAPGDAFQNALFRNPGHGEKSLTIRLAGVKTNRAAIGARIRLGLPDGRSVWRTVGYGSSFGCNTFEQTIAVGSAAVVPVVEVHWPTSNTVQTFRDVPSGHVIAIEELATAYRTTDPVRTASR